MEWIFSFQLESSDRCSFDYLMIRDGFNESASLVGKFCNDKIPPPVLTTDNQMWIYFRSDGTLTESGFSAIISVSDTDERKAITSCPTLISN